MIKIKTIKRRDFDEFKDDILNFYSTKYKFPITDITVDNSTIICLAYDDNHVIGAIRAISDLSRHGIIVDLFVNEDSRKKGVGKLLLISIKDELKNNNVKNIGLATEPGIDWLVDFYKDNGFVEIKDSICMELEN